MGSYSKIVAVYICMIVYNNYMCKESRNETLL